MKRSIAILLLVLLAPTAYSETILLPIFVDSAGGHASFFVTELRIFNESIRPVTISGLSASCDFESRQIEIGPKQMVSSFCKTGNPGEIIDVPEDAELHYSLRIRDTSRSAKSAGVEIPVIRWNDHKRVIHLLGVRANEQFRARLRVYSFGESLIYMAAFTENMNTPIWGQGLILTGRSPDSPSYFEAELPPSLDPYRVKVEVWPSGAYPGSYVWAFVAMTNNETQEITIVTPQL